MITHDAIFTNVATTADNQPWWEGKKDGEPARDWQGRAYDQHGRTRRAPELAFHRLRNQQSKLLEPCRSARRRADLRDRLRRAPQAGSAAGV